MGADRPWQTGTRPADLSGHVAAERMELVMPNASWVMRSFDSNRRIASDRNLTILAGRSSLLQRPSMIPTRVEATATAAVQVGDDAVRHWGNRFLPL